MAYVLISSGSNYNFSVGNNTYITTEAEEVVEHLRKVLDEKMAENIYTRGNYKLKAAPIKVLDALIPIGFSVVSSGGSDGRFIWTLVKTRQESTSTTTSTAAATTAPIGSDASNNAIATTNATATLNPVNNNNNGNNNNNNSNGGGGGGSSSQPPVGQTSVAQPSTGSCSNGHPHSQPTSRRRHHHGSRENRGQNADCSPSPFEGGERGHSHSHSHSHHHHHHEHDHDHHDHHDHHGHGHRCHSPAYSPDSLLNG